MTKDKTNDQIQREGLAALRKRLGVAGMIRFLQQFDNGRGDYTAERQEWAEKISLEEIQSLSKGGRRKTRKAS